MRASMLENDAPATPSSMLDEGVVLLSFCILDDVLGHAILSEQWGPTL